MLLFPLSAGDSKSLAVIVRAPLEELIAKNEPSVPLLDQVTDSLAVNVWTEVVFSEIEIELVALVAEEGPVIVGAVASGIAKRRRTTPEPPAPPGGLGTVSGEPDLLMSSKPDPPPPPPVNAEPAFPLDSARDPLAPPPRPPTPPCPSTPMPPPPPPAKYTVPALVCPTVKLLATVDVIHDADFPSPPLPPTAVALE